jgi:DNA-binding beta-propeller fold protein YncE
MLAALVVTGCGAKPHARLGAAEPAVAPAAIAAPLGQQVKVGDAPEGIVYDPTTKLVAVAVRSPNRLVLLDGATLRIVKQIPLAGHARHLQLAAPGGPIIVPEEDANQVVLVSLPSGTVAHTIKTGTSPHDAAAVTGGYVAGDEFGKSITIARTGRNPRTIAEVTQPGGVVDFGDQVAIVDVGDFSVSTFRVSDGSRISKIPAGQGPTHGVRTSSGQLLVADTRGNQLLTFAENPLANTGSLTLPGSPYGLAADPASPIVWVTLTGRNQVVGVLVAGANPTEIARLDTVEQPDTVAVAPGSHTLWIAGNRAGVVQRLTR